MHFKLILPLWNVEQWIVHSIGMLKQQTHRNFQCILVDDTSTDRSVEFIRQSIGSDSRFILHKNIVRSYALQNVYNGIKLLQPDKEDVIVIVDGDDWLATNKTLETVAKTYKDNDCWLTYGSYTEYPSGNRGVFCQQLPQDAINTNNIRKIVFMTSHLRTFKFWLWDLIDEKDFLDNNGQFYKMACDVCAMMPMVEMCGNRSKFIKDVLYTYNLSNVNNVHKVNSALQGKLSQEIRAREPYGKL